MTANAERERRAYDPALDKRTDPGKRGRCGRAWCRNPARWVWEDAAGANRHECDTHAGLTSEPDGDDRVREGLRLENNGLCTQRIQAILNRKSGYRHFEWAVVYENGVPTRMVWASTAARV